jgi:hypothetical protein
MSGLWIKPVWVFSLCALACAPMPEEDLSVSLFAPQARSARVKLSAALDLGGLKNESFASRIVIDEIVVNISSLRLLGNHPAIPRSGQRLIQEDYLLLTATDSEVALFPFDVQMRDEQLSVYARIDQSPTLDTASVVVKARLLADPAINFQHGLRLVSQTPTSPNPDGEPNHEGEDQSPNPDGEPNRDEHEESPNPDGEPNRDEGDGEGEDSENPDGTVQQGLHAATSGAALSTVAVPFILRGFDSVELVVRFDPYTEMDMTLTIPATRWISPAIIRQMEAALEQKQAGPKTQKNASLDTQAADKTLILDSKTQETKQSAETIANEDYRLVDDRAKDPRRLRSR